MKFLRFCLHKFSWLILFLALPKKKLSAEWKVWKSSPTRFFSHSRERVRMSIFQARPNLIRLIDSAEISSSAALCLTSSERRYEAGNEHEEYQLPRMIKIPLNDTISRMINYPKMGLESAAYIVRLHVFTQTLSPGMRLALRYDDSVNPPSASSSDDLLIADHKFNALPISCTNAN